MPLLPRPALAKSVESAFRSFPAVALLGPRQCGKTTLARSLAARHHAHYFDLESPRDLARLERDPQGVLEAVKGWVVLDEIQRQPGLLPLLRVLCDRPSRPARFLLLGSADPALMRGASESLAGRLAHVEMGGFNVGDGASGVARLWLRGGFPRALLAGSEADSVRWREEFVRAFLERDLPLLQPMVPAATLRRFWGMLAHYHGQTWNGSEIGASLGFSHQTARRYLDLLTGAFIVRQLPPYHANAGKRLVRSPKVYLRDSGLFHYLLGLGGREQLENHPKYGASWEGFGIEEVLRLAGERQAYFWATHQGAELDLLIERGDGRWGFEFKAVSAPQFTRSMASAREALGLAKLWVVTPGERRYSLGRGVEAIGLGTLLAMPRKSWWSR